MASTPFEIAIDAFVKKAKGRIDAFCIEFAQDLNEAIVTATPVKSGFLRASWWGSIGAPEQVEPKEPDDSDKGIVTVSRLNLGIAGQPLAGKAYFLTNGASYAQFVEYGTAKMAPRAFVRSTVARAEEIADAAATRVAGGGAA